MILTDDNFATIVKAVTNGRNIYNNIKNSIQFLLSGNTAGILVVLFTSIFGLPVPFTAVHLLFINLLTDSLPALAISMEKSSKDLLNEKPRSSKESILTKDFLIDCHCNSRSLFYRSANGCYDGKYDGICYTLFRTFVPWI